MKRVPYAFMGEMERRGLPKNHSNIWLGQLVRYELDHISYNLASARLSSNQNICPLVLAKDVLPYLIRRAEENTSVAGHKHSRIRINRERA